MGSGLNLSSGRVIGLGRLLLATLFVIVMAFDPSRSSGPRAIDILPIGYLLFAAGLVAATWRNYWLDAALGGPAHALDIAMFTATVYLTEGDGSPFFTFFVFVILGAAIRWGWRATALTAILLALLYAIASAVAIAPGNPFEPERFVIRLGHLVILSLILIWFAVNQWGARLSGPVQDISMGTTPMLPTVEAALEWALSAGRAGAGALVWRDGGKAKAIMAVRRDGPPTVIDLDASALVSIGDRPLLYDLAKRRTLTRDDERNLRIGPLGPGIQSIASQAGLTAGVAVPIASEAGQGQLYLEAVRGLSSDHLEIGRQIGAVMARHMHRRALMRAAEEQAESRSRLAIARDLHDSVVQFLAGTAIRLEGMKRAEQARDLKPELGELKDLVLQEQTELRSFITALRSSSQIDMAEFAKDLQGLATRLARQWHIQCTFSAEPARISVSSRLQLDAQQLVREAVANAVRHAGAKNVSIRLEASGEDVRLDFINDGKPYPKSEPASPVPKSLKERVEAAGGSLDIARGMGVTKLSMSLPAAGKAA